MAPAPSKHAPTAPGAVPWQDEVLFHVDVGSELHARLAIKPLVALLGTCKTAGDAIAFKPAKARAALAKYGVHGLCDHAAGVGDEVPLHGQQGAQGLLDAAHELSVDVEASRVAR